MSYSISYSVMSLKLTTGHSSVQYVPLVIIRYGDFSQLKVRKLTLTLNQRLLGTRFWKAMFDPAHPCMSWLFDLDQDMIRQANPKLDWEMLFRKVQQQPQIADCCGDTPDADYEIYRGVLEHIPPGLEGRRRLWKLVGEMYIGDRSSEWQCDYSGWGPSNVCVRPQTSRPCRDYPEGKLLEVKRVPVYWDKNGDALDEQTLRML